MGKRRVIYAEFVRESSIFRSAVSKHSDGMWYLKKTDIFNRRMRFNPREQILEVQTQPDEWDIYDAYLYGVNGWDSNGNLVHID